MKNTHRPIGSSLQSFLDDEGIQAQANAQALKRVLAWQIQSAMKAKEITKTAMAKRMKTSRAHLDRLLDPDNNSVQLDTVQRAAAAVGRTVRIQLV